MHTESSCEDVDDVDDNGGGWTVCVTETTSAKHLSAPPLFGSVIPGSLIRGVEVVEGYCSHSLLLVWAPGRQDVPRPLPSSTVTQPRPPSTLRKTISGPENMGIWEEGEEKRLIKQCSLTGEETNIDLRDDCGASWSHRREMIQLISSPAAAPFVPTILCDIGIPSRSENDGDSLLVVLKTYENRDLGKGKSCSNPSRSDGIQPYFFFLAAPHPTTTSMLYR
ncbi:unnamed protein product [Leuciscus chuanchicus]